MVEKVSLQDLGRAKRIVVDKDNTNIVVGYYEGKRLLYVARVRNGFARASTEALYNRFRGLDRESCPFQNLP
ncbi:MAG: hypothetical protein JO121_28835, partial [Deltaproteobacteria bacterium]|nr:hypothetical protein [Deltaproteobacteria bacterium]